MLCCCCFCVFTSSTLVQVKRTERPWPLIINRLVIFNNYKRKRRSAEKDSHTVESKMWETQGLREESATENLSYGIREGDDGFIRTKEESHTVKY